MSIKKFLLIVIFMAILIPSYFYFSSQQENLKTLALLLKTYTASDHTGPIKLIRHGRKNDGGYLVAEKSFIVADVLLGYGIADDNSFEEQFSNIYRKPSYGFDCGIKRIESHNKRFTFIDECISSENNLYNPQNSSHKVSTFSQQLNSLNISGKKVFIKMDIEGSEYEAFKNILPYLHNITGIVLEIHMSGNNDVTQAIQLLSAIEKEFLLVHIHGNNCRNEAFPIFFSQMKIPKVIELTLINKALVKEYAAENNSHYPQSIDMKNCPHLKELEFSISN